MYKRVVVAHAAATEAAEWRRWEGSAVNYVDVDPTSTRRQVFRRNLVHAICVWGGTLAFMALIYWVFFGVLLRPYW